MSTWPVLFLRVSRVMLKRWILECGMRTINSTFPPNILSYLHNYINVLWTLFCSEFLPWQSSQSMKKSDDVWQRLNVYYIVYKDLAGRQYLRKHLIHALRSFVLSAATSLPLGEVLQACHFGMQSSLQIITFVSKLSSPYTFTWTYALGPAPCLYLNGV
jgi:hypothetical protein